MENKDKKVNKVIKIERLLSNDRIIKYKKARLEGKSKEDSKRVAGYAPSTKTTTIEKSDTYKRLTIKDALLQHTTYNELAKEHMKNILQDEDKGAKNKAIEMAYNRIEPTNTPQEEEERVIIVLRDK